MLIHILFCCRSCQLTKLFLSDGALCIVVLYGKENMDQIRHQKELKTSDIQNVDMDILTRPFSIHSDHDDHFMLHISCYSWQYSVPDKRGVSGQNPDKVGNLTRQINGKRLMIWRGPYLLTHYNPSFTSCLSLRAGSCLGPIRKQWKPQKSLSSRLVRDSHGFRRSCMDRKREPAHRLILPGTYLEPCNIFTLYIWKYLIFFFLWPKSDFMRKWISKFWLCPHVPANKGISIVFPLFRSHCLALVYCLGYCIGSCVPVHEDRTKVLTYCN